MAKVIKGFIQYLITFTKDEEERDRGYVHGIPLIVKK